MRTVGLLLFAVFAVFASGGCASKARIPDGVYVPAQREIGTLTVRDNQVEFDMPANDPHTHRSRGTYRYELTRDGTIQFSGSSNDAYFLFAVVFPGQWRWTGGAIERAEDNGRKISFEAVR